MGTRPQSSRRISGGIASMSLLVVACSASDAQRVEKVQASHLADDVGLLKKAKQEPPKPPPAWAPAHPSFGFVLPVDHGLRADSGGEGSFLSPRAHGKHNGIDLLAPLSTPVLAACHGVAKYAERGGYGRTVQLVCKLPQDLGGSDDLYASFFYAHLDKSSVPSGGWTKVALGDRLGTVGKTGNAKGPKIKPHLHLEVIIRDGESDAKSETHSGLNADGDASATFFMGVLRETCLEPAGFVATAGLRRERRVDPFVLLTCGGRSKPPFSRPMEPEIKTASVDWKAHYSALGFDVNIGPRHIP